MNREQVEAFHYRWQVLFPSAPRLDQTDANVRLEEWMATPEIVDCPIDVAEEAFAEWRVANDWPPTVHRFVELVDRVKFHRQRLRVEAAQQELLAENDEALATPEEAKGYIAQIREKVEQIVRRSREVLEP